MKYLHHYTSIESLECILKNRTIRFSNLSMVNDTNEGETYDFGNIGKYIFVSCWTFNGNEEIPMWNLYGDNFKGVRISIPYPIFPEYFYEGVGITPMLFELEKSFCDKYIILPTEDRKFIKPIIYTDEKEKLNPITQCTINGLSGFKYGQIGKCKSTKWKFEAESRFIIYTIPTNNKIELDEFDEDVIDEGIELMKRDTNIDIEFLDLNIRSDLFNKIEVMLGPKVDKTLTTKLENLKDCYNHSMKIIRSELTGLIR